MFKKIMIFILFLLLTAFIMICFIPVTHNMVKSSVNYDQYKYLMAIILYFCVFILLYLGIDKGFKNSNRLFREAVDFKKYKKEEEYIPNTDFYFRDIPLKKDIFRVFWIGYQYGFIKNRTNLINALLLKWCLEKRLEFNNNGYRIINMNIPFENKYEEDLFFVIRNQYSNRFIKLKMFNSKFILDKIDSILLCETSELRGEEKIININREDVITKVIKPDVDEVYGLKNFLLNFGTIEDKKINEVKLWEEYLIYAELFGIADQVKSEFKKHNVNFSLAETNIKRINTGIMVGVNIMLFISLFLIALIIMIPISVVILLVAHFTWN